MVAHDELQGVSPCSQFNSHLCLPSAEVAVVVI